MKPILVHVHVFYTSVWPELRACLQRIAPCPMELYVTFAEPCADIEADVAACFPGAHVLMVPNRGFDVAPFLQVLSQVNLDDYSYVVKLHTKRGADAQGVGMLRGEEWRQALLAFLSSHERLQEHVAAFEADARIGMQADWRLFVGHDPYDKKASRALRRWLKERGLPRCKFCYVAGSMFMARAEVMKMLQGFGLGMEDFAPSAQHHAQLAHVVERLMGYCVYAQGYMLSDRLEFEAAARHLRRMRLRHALESLGRFLLQVKRTSSGRRVVKVLKVPVWFGKQKK